MQPFLLTMLNLQAFQQFIQSRLELLNAGREYTDDVFELHVNMIKNDPMQRKSKKPVSSIDR